MTIGDAAIGFYLDTINLTSGDITRANYVDLPEMAVPYNTTPTLTNVTDVDNSRMFEDVVNHGGYLSIEMEIQDSGDNFFLHAQTITAKTGGWRLSDLTWFGEGVITAADNDWDIRVTRSGGDIYGLLNNPQPVLSTAVPVSLGTYERVSSSPGVGAFSLTLTSGAVTAITWNPAPGYDERVSQLPWKTGDWARFGECTAIFTGAPIEFFGRFITPATMAPTTDLSDCVALTNTTEFIIGSTGGYLDAGAYARPQGSVKSRIYHIFGDPGDGADEDGECVEWDSTDLRLEWVTCP